MRLPIFADANACAQMLLLTAAQGWDYVLSMDCPDVARGLTPKAVYSICYAYGALMTRAAFRMACKVYVNLPA